MKNREKSTCNPQKPTRNHEKPWSWRDKYEALKKVIIFRHQHGLNNLLDV